MSLKSRKSTILLILKNIDNTDLQILQTNDTQTHKYMV